MKKNIGFTDQTLRILTALLFCGLVVSNAVIGAWAMALTTACFVLITTSVTAICPLYTLLGINTMPVKQSNQ